MIPDRFRGVWQRVSLSVDGGPWTEPAQVIWVQAGSIFGDIRLPFPGRADAHPAMSFAGTLHWSDPVLSWDHKLDLYAEPGDDGDDGGIDGTDIAQVSWHGAELVCAGVFPRGQRDVPYVEVWRRLAGSRGFSLAMIRHDRNGVVVQVGDHALTIVDDRSRGGEYRACYRSRRDDQWAVSLSIGDRADSLPVPPEPTDLSEATVLGGRCWYVVERSFARPLAAAG
jgi:hypothetical protein